jgi:hypothetical protein
MSHLLTSDTTELISTREAVGSETAAECADHAPAHPTRWSALDVGNHGKNFRTR